MLRRGCTILSTCYKECFMLPFQCDKYVVNESISSLLPMFESSHSLLEIFHLLHTICMNDSNLLPGR
ncbi:hypothetical protein KP509_09G015300 [Ceratopteris richardii]|uniref:Uncharacterized protein n=1 Tax=Ceratopteris richardii TaxID=49495 RepID=A0A8T2TY96_CERRI|nr:hypothetical protein KP509_09G015300 [Ceratopteris richardii]